MREFNKDRGFRRSFDRKGSSFGKKRRDFKDFDRGDSDRPRRRDFGGVAMMHKVICDKCGKSCEVPFKPNPNKPVYCENCFGKNNRPNDSKGNNDKLDEINRKLDKILNLLE